MKQYCFNIFILSIPVSTTLKSCLLPLSMVWSQGNVATCPGHMVQMHNSTRAGQWTRRAIDNQRSLQGRPIVLPGLIQFIFLKIYSWTQLSVPSLLLGERCLSTFARISFLSFSSLGFALGWAAQTRKPYLFSSSQSHFSVCNSRASVSCWL